MPFTIAHAAVAPPLWRLTRGRLVLSALVIGSTAPDLEYLVHMRTHRTVGHTIPGIFVMCVPATLVVLLLWHKLIGPQLSRLLPERLAPLAGAASAPFSFLGPARLGAICASAAVGAASHIIWDACTHEGSFFVRHLEVLQHAAWNGGPPLYLALQYASSGIGMLLVAFWLAHPLRRRPVDAPVRRLPPLRAGWRWGSIGALSAGVTAAAVANAGNRWVTDAWATPRDIVAAGAVGGMAAGVVLAVVASAVLAMGDRAHRLTVHRPSRGLPAVR